LVLHTSKLEHAVGRFQVFIAQHDEHPVSAADALHELRYRLAQTEHIPITYDRNAPLLRRIAKPIDDFLAFRAFRRHITPSI